MVVESMVILKISLLMFLYHYLSGQVGGIWVWVVRDFGIKLTVSPLYFN